MKISIPIEVEFDNMNALIDDLSHLQTYKLSADDEMTLVDIADVADTLAKHVKAREIKHKTGRWERHYSRPNVYADLWWYCSVCGYKNDNQYANCYHHYCPNCGCKMEVEHDE